MGTADTAAAADATADKYDIIEKIALNLDTANRVWAIAGDYFLPILPGGPHAVCQRINKGIDAAAHALQVDNDYVNVTQHLLSRLARLTIKRIDRQSSLSIGRVRCLNHVVLNIAANSMLRAEQRGQVDVWMFVKQVGRMTKTMIDRGLVTHQGNPPAANQIELFIKQPLDPKFDSFHFSLHCQTSATEN